MMARENWKTGQVTIRLSHDIRSRAEKLAKMMPKMTPNDFYSACVEAVMGQIEGEDRTPNLVVALRALVAEEKRTGND